MNRYQQIFERILADPRYQRNLDWGRPRPGHPEGNIRAHIAELEANLETLKPDIPVDQYSQLKLLIHTHDAFKPDAERDVHIAHPASHASLARAFLAEFCDEPDLLAIVQHHDVPYALWQQAQQRGAYKAARLEQLLDEIDDWELFLAFVWLDGSTAGKRPEPREWFFSIIGDKIEISPLFERLSG